MVESFAGILNSFVGVLNRILGISRLTDQVGQDTSNHNRELVRIWNAQLEKVRFKSTYPFFSRAALRSALASNNRVLEART
jgi:hypothetical protein